MIYLIMFLFIFNLQLICKYIHAFMVEMVYLYNKLNNSNGMLRYLVGVIKYTNSNNGMKKYINIILENNMLSPQNKKKSSFRRLL